MKEIKFRAWDKKNKKMVQVASYEFIPFSGETVIQWGKEQYRESCCKSADDYPERLELMQYTGLKDKNGKEICEGDIVRGSKDKVNQVIGFEMGSFFIKWKFKAEGKLLGKILKSEMKYSELWRWYDKVEVIGNIYENKELIE